MNQLRLMTVWLLLLVAGAGGADEYGFSIDRARLLRESERYFLDADIRYRFSEDAIEALEHGVPLTLNVNLMVYRKREYLWDDVVIDIKLPFRIRYHALAKLFQISNESSGVQRNFASLPAALAALGQIRRMPVLKTEQLDAVEEYDASIKVQLDLEALPLPLRPLAYLSPQWYLASSWFTWPLKK